MSERVTMEELDRARGDFANVARRLNDMADDRSNGASMVVRLQLEHEKRELDRLCERLVLRWIAQGCQP